MAVPPLQPEHPLQAPAGQLPFVSVVIPVWNAPDLIASCLRALAEQEFPKDRYEVIVVDNGSTDDTSKVVRSFPSVQLLSEPVAGSYRARNLGLSHASGDYVAFTDADCVPDRGWLSALADAAREDPDAGIHAGRIELFRTGQDSSRICELYERLFAFNQEANVRSGMCVTANWASPRPLLLELGGFDASLKSGGDAECARRIRAAGRRIAYQPVMLVRHPIRADIGEQMRKRRRVVGGRIAGERALRGPWSWLWTYSLIGGSQIKRVWRTLGHSMADRLKLSLLVVLLWAVSMTEVARIAIGGSPRRS